MSEGQETIELTLINATGGVVIGSPNRIVIALRDNPERRDLLAEEQVARSKLFAVALYGGIIK